MVYLRNLALVSRVDDLEGCVTEHIEVIDHPLELLRLDESLQLHISRRIVSTIRSINALAVNHINDSRDDCVVGGASVVAVDEVLKEVIVIAILHPAQARVLADLWRGVRSQIDEANVTLHKLQSHCSLCARSFAARVGRFQCFDRWAAYKSCR